MFNLVVVNDVLMIIAVKTVNGHISLKRNGYCAVCFII